MRLGIHMSSNQLILNALSSLMDHQGSWKDRFPGYPFVNSEKEFGIKMAPNKAKYPKPLSNIPHMNTLISNSYMKAATAR